MTDNRLNATIDVSMSKDIIFQF